MNKTIGLLRIGIVLSVLWLLNGFVANTSSVTGFDIDGFVVVVIIPLVILWGLVWIAAGFRNIASNFSNEDEDKNDQDK